MLRKAIWIKRWWWRLQKASPKKQEAL